jgi:hypothetical protein
MQSEETSKTLLKNKLLQFAKADLYQAKRRGSIAICETKLGLLELSYRYEDKIYVITKSNLNSLQSETVTELNTRAMQEFLIENVYRVEIQN